MGMNGIDFVLAICRSLNEMDKDPSHAQESGHYPIHKFITHVVYVRQGSIFMPVEELEVCFTSSYPVSGCEMCVC